jgi:hypothetical protein
MKVLLLAGLTLGQNFADCDFACQQQRMRETDPWYMCKERGFAIPVVCVREEGY